MTRFMRDALYPAGIPLDTPLDYLLATYVDHPEVTPPPMQQIAARFPNHRIVTIAAHGGDALCCDVETGAMTPADVPAWLTRQRARGVAPWCYATATNWGNVALRCALARVALPLWWEANWRPDVIIRPDSIGVQYLHPAGYDQSLMADYIPGFDPAPIDWDALVNIEMIRSDDKATPPGSGAVIAHLGGGVLVPVKPSTFLTWTNLGREVTNLAPGPWADYLAMLSSAASIPSARPVISGVALAMSQALAYAAPVTEQSV